MRRPHTLLTGLLFGALTSLPVIALFYAGQQLAGLPFVPFDVFDWLARVMPGGILTLFIDTTVQVVKGLNLGELSDTAKTIEQLMAIGLMMVTGALMGGFIAWAVDRGPWVGRQIGMLAGGILLGIIVIVEFAHGFSGDPLLALLWTGFLIVGWGGLLGDWIEAWLRRPDAPEMTEADRANRRSLLAKIAGGSLAITLAFGGLGRLLSQRSADTGAGEALPGAPPAGPPAGTAAAPAGIPPVVVRTGIEPAPGTRPELTSNEDFYRIDINLVVPVIAEATWSLEVAGLFDNPRPMTLADLMALPAVTQPVTMACISNPIGGELIGTSNWTGVRLVDLMKELGLRPEAKELQIVASDAFFESVTAEDLKDPRVLLVYGMNGQTLPVEHGFPLRIYIPNRYGMKQPKWIRRIEALDHEGNGYWVVRGWSKEARPHVLSMIDVVARDREVDGRIPIGGIAWAGDRGIQKVEVQVDNGTWEPATLLAPPLGPLTWVLWRYDWPKVSGRHSFRVRATDGTGALQIEEESASHPDGATGYHQVTQSI